MLCDNELTSFLQFTLKLIKRASSVLSVTTSFPCGRSTFTRCLLHPAAVARRARDAAIVAKKVKRILLLSRCDCDYTILRYKPGSRNFGAVPGRCLETGHEPMAKDPRKLWEIYTPRNIANEVRLRLSTFRAGAPRSSQPDLPTAYDATHARNVGQFYD